MDSGEKDSTLGLKGDWKEKNIVASQFLMLSTFIQETSTGSGTTSLISWEKIVVHLS